MQAEFLYRQIIAEIPWDPGTISKPRLVEVDNGLRYVAKADRGHEPLRAREWLAHSLAHDVGVAAPNFRALQDRDGKTLFGSQFVAGTVDRQEHINALLGLYPIHLMTEIVSSSYAFDVFVCNPDRHLGNYLFFHLENNLRCMIFDFSESEMLTTESPFDAVPLPHTRTRTCGNIMRQKFGFALTSAADALDRIKAISTDKIQRYIEDMPSDWLPQGRRSRLIQWWQSGGNITRADVISKGFQNASLL